MCAQSLKGERRSDHTHAVMGEPVADLIHRRHVIVFGVSFYRWYRTSNKPAR
jgi:hypothetical protein